MKLIIKLLELILLVGLIILGIVFIPDDWVREVKNKLLEIEQFVQTVAAKQGPIISQEFYAKWNATKLELNEWRQAIEEKFWPIIGDWIMKNFNGQ